MYNWASQNKKVQRAKWHVSTMSVSIASQKMTLRLHDQAAPLPELERIQPTRLGDDEDRVTDL